LPVQTGHSSLNPAVISKMGDHPAMDAEERQW